MKTSVSKPQREMLARLALGGQARVGRMNNAPGLATFRALKRRGLATGEYVHGPNAITDAGRVALHCNNGLHCIAPAPSGPRSCICLCGACKAAGRACLRIAT